MIVLRSTGEITMNQLKERTKTNGGLKFIQVVNVNMNKFTWLTSAHQNFN